MKKSFDTSKYKNKQNNIRSLKISPPLRSIANIYPEADYKIKLETDELSTICPKTGLPDFAHISIQYIPNQYLVEEKSLKLYLTAYRNIGIFQENATNKIFEDFLKKIKPRWLFIQATWKKRGGIAVIVEREYSHKQKNIPLL